MSEENRPTLHTYDPTAAPDAAEWALSDHPWAVRLRADRDEWHHRRLAEAAERIGGRWDPKPRDVEERRRDHELGRRAAGDVAYVFPEHLTGPGAAAYPPPSSGWTTRHHGDAGPLDLDDHSRCPRAGACGVCGRTSPLRITTLDTPLGVLCVTLCAGCILAQRFPKLGAADAVRLVLDHCEHLGITPEEMADLRDRETT